MWNRRRRAAISQAKVRKECRRYGAFFGGHRAGRGGTPRDANPCKGEDQKAWFDGWDFSQFSGEDMEDLVNAVAKRMSSRSASET